MVIPNTMLEQPLSHCTHYQTHLSPTTWKNPVGWQHTTQSFHHQQSSLYELRIGSTGFIFFGTPRKRPTGCPETSVRIYHYSLRNNPEDRTAHLLLPVSLKSRPIFSSPLTVLIHISYPQNMSNYYSLYTVQCVHLYILVLW